MTRSLADLLASVEGRRFLEQRGVHVDATHFASAMAPPRRGELTDALGLSRGDRVAYVGQQLQCDYAHSASEKFRALRDLSAEEGVEPVSLPLDTDRAGSSKWNTTLTWPGEGKRRTARLIPHRLAELEMRFAPVEPARLEEVVATVEQWHAALASGRPVDERGERGYAGFVSALTDGPPRTLADTNRSLTAWLLRDGIGFDPPHALISELIAWGLVHDPLEHVIAHIDDVIAVFNEAVDELAAADVDPQVRHLPDDYLPLRYACPEDGRRSPLRSERRGSDRFAVMTCRSCDTEYRIHLGSRSTSLEELAATGRWSTDVTVPLYVNDLVSGVVAGQSTALYGLVLDQITTTVLAGAPIPAFVPPTLADPPGGEVDSLFYACLAGTT